MKEYYKTGDLKKEILFKDGKAVSGSMYTKDGKKRKMTNAHFHKMGFEYIK